MKCNRKKALPTGFDLAKINDENILNAQLYLSFASRSMMIAIRERRQYLDFANRMSFYVRELLTMGAKELHDTNGFGLSRLSSVFSACRVDWFGLMLVYLQTMDPAAVQEEMRKRLDRFNGMGIFGTEEHVWQKPGRRIGV